MKKLVITPLFILILISFFACKETTHSQSENVAIDDTFVENEFLVIPRASHKIVIDGKVGTDEWTGGRKYFFDNVWVGDNLEPNDFKGAYKMKYDENYIYVIAQTYDDTLVDTHPDELTQYWDDDCLEIFIDEDNSKGNHQYNHNAFAYHISLSGKVMDIGPDSLPHFYEDVINARHTNGRYSVWEVAIPLFDDSYVDGGDNVPLKLDKGKEIGFMIAYCDNDSSETREHFIGSEFIEGEDKNRGWIDAGVFGNFVLE